MRPTTSGPRRPRPVVVAVLGWLLALLLVCEVAALFAVGANGPEDPRLAPAGASAPSAGIGGAGAGPGGAGPVEFGNVAFRVTPAGGTRVPATGEHCAMLAETETQRGRGMMGRRDFGGYDAMVFRFPADTTGTFYMRNVAIPLSIAWFDSRGRLVSTADMEPCPDREGCPRYPPGGPYRFAVEVEKGGLGRLGIRDGSVLELRGTCSPR